MCLDASQLTRPPHQPATPPPAETFLSLMNERLAAEGGLIAEGALRSRWRHRGRPPHELDALLAGNRLRSVAGGSQRWLPAFQLHADGVTPRADVAAVADELAGGMDADEILAWFACRNAALDGQTPIARLRTGLPAVLDAARLDRFICSV